MKGVVGDGHGTTVYSIKAEQAVPSQRHHGIARMANVLDIRTSDSIRPQQVDHEPSEDPDGQWTALGAVRIGFRLHHGILSSSRHSHGSVPAVSRQRALHNSTALAALEEAPRRHARV